MPCQAFGWQGLFPIPLSSRKDGPHPIYLFQCSFRKWCLFLTFYTVRKVHLEAHTWLPKITNTHPDCHTSKCWTHLI